MKQFIFTGLIISLIAVSGAITTSRDQDEIEILERKVMNDIQSTWSDFDTCFPKMITLELKRKDNRDPSDKNLVSARFSYAPGFVHKFYLICSATESFHCSLKLYIFNEAKGLPNQLVGKTEISGGNKGFVSFSHLLNTKNEWLLVLENDSDTEGVAFATFTVQIPENDDFRRLIFERNKEVEARKRKIYR